MFDFQPNIGSMLIVRIITRMNCAAHLTLQSIAWRRAARSLQRGRKQKCFKVPSEHGETVAPKKLLIFAFRLMSFSGKSKSQECDPEGRSIKEISELMTMSKYIKVGVGKEDVARAIETFLEFTSDEKYWDQNFFKDEKKQYERFKSIFSGILNETALKCLEGGNDLGVNDKRLLKDDICRTVNKNKACRSHFDV